MSRFIDLSGSRFGRLVVLNNWKRENKRTYWYCHCYCGNQLYVRSDHLKDGFISSCGCLQKETRVKQGNKIGGKYQKRLDWLGQARNALIRDYKRNAVKRGYDFKLLDDEMIFLFMQDCYYCGNKPSNIYRSRSETGDFVYNGIDRKDNNIGYTIENSVPCCGICNRAKMTLPEQEFINWIRRIQNKWI